MERDRKLVEHVFADMRRRVMERDRKEGSPAWKLVEHVFANTEHRSWLRINTAVHEALTLAVTARVRFDRDDFNRFENELRGSYWLGANNECFFEAAVKANNRSACMAYEHWRGRKPFKLYGRRLFVGSKIRAVDHGQSEDAAFVTSFSDDGDHLIACTYGDSPPGYRCLSPKVKRRLTLTRKRIQEMERARKEENKRVDG